MIICLDVILHGHHLLTDAHLKLLSLMLYCSDFIKSHILPDTTKERISQFY